MFPNTPIVGVFGNGEIGANYIPGAEKENKQGEKKVINLLWMTSMTIGVVLLDDDRCCTVRFGFKY